MGDDARSPSPSPPPPLQPSFSLTQRLSGSGSCLFSIGLLITLLSGFAFVLVGMLDSVLNSSSRPKTDLNDSFTVTKSAFAIGLLVVFLGIIKIVRGLFRRPTPPPPPAPEA